jgi:hypothetical protein
MDKVAAAEFANLVGRFYQNLATQVGDTIHQNIGKMGNDQVVVLMGDQTRLISYSNTFYALSDRIAFDGADMYFKSVVDATGQISDALKHIDRVDKVISIAAGVITLAGGIVSRNVGMIASSLQTLQAAIL